MGLMAFGSTDRLIRVPFGCRQSPYARGEDALRLGEFAGFKIYVSELSVP